MKKNDLDSPNSLYSKRKKNEKKYISFRIFICLRFYDVTHNMYTAIATALLVQVRAHIN